MDTRHVGCLTLLVLLLFVLMLGGVIIDQNCWWGDIPIISEIYGLKVSEEATCR